MTRWLTASLDTPSRDAETFWRYATGSTLSPRRDAHGDFVTLLPAHGDAFLRMQLVDDGPARAHLDLHVDDVAAEAGRMVQRGALVVRDLESTDRQAETQRHLRAGASIGRVAADRTVLRDPAGREYCLTDLNPRSSTG